MEKGDVALVVLFVLLAITLIFLFVPSRDVRLAATASEPTTSNVTIAQSISFTLSDDLANGIEFGEIETIPATDVNATDNNASTEFTSGTSLFVNVSVDSNTAVEVCLAANSSMENPTLDTIPLVGETYLNSSVTNLNEPGPETAGVSLTLDFQNASNDIPVGAAEYYRFWLDIPGGTPTGTYNNSLIFTGQAAGSGLVC